MIQLKNICLSYGDRELLKDINLSLSYGDRISLTGANGSGKSTLMKTIAGIVSPDSGELIVNKNTKITYLPQSCTGTGGRTLMEEAQKAFASLKVKEEEKKAIEIKLESSKDGETQTTRLLKRQHQLQEELLSKGYYNRDQLIYRVLFGLGFCKEDLLKETSSFSGGWQMRIALARVLLEDADFLLLDEPTNYLDLDARYWLKSYLTEFKGGFLLVSHDRYFIDTTVSQVIELFGGKLKRYNCNYTEYQERRRKELENLYKSYYRQQDEIEKIENFINRFRYNSSRAGVVQSRIKYLEKLKRIEIPDSVKQPHITFPEPPHSGRTVLTLEKLSKYYGEKKVIDNLNLTVSRGERVFISGRNGAGKSTLLRIIAGADPDYRGAVKYGKDVQPGYFAQELSEMLDTSLSVIEEVESDSPTNLIPHLRNMLGAFLFQNDDVYKKVSVLSGGERSRLALLKLLLKPCNLLLLDEPTNHLDITSKDVLLKALQDYSGTLLFVSHDRHFIENLATSVLELDESRYRYYHGDYNYYLRRKQQERETTGTSVITRVSPTQTQARKEKNWKTDSTGSKSRREEEKRLKREIRRLEKEEEEILSGLENIDREKEEIHHKLSQPEVYSDGEKTKELKEAMERNSRHQRELTSRWEEVEANLRNLKDELLAMNGENIVS